MILSVSGLSGSGKSTLSKRLSELLNWPHISIGDYFREIARHKGWSIYELSTMALKDPEIDKEITRYALTEIKKYENCILDGHGAALIGEAYEQFSIFLHCPLWVRAKRICDRTSQDQFQIKEKLEKLDRETVQRFKKVYEENILDMDHYDLIINTDRLCVEKILTLINDLIKLVKM